MSAAKSRSPPAIQGHGDAGGVEAELGADVGVMLVLAVLVVGVGASWGAGVGAGVLDGGGDELDDGATLGSLVGLEGASVVLVVKLDADGAMLGAGVAAGGVTGVTGPSDFASRMLGVVGHFLYSICSPNVPGSSIHSNTGMLPGCPCTAPSSPLPYLAAMSAARAQSCSYDMPVARITARSDG